MDVKRSGSQPSAKGPAEWFTGTVRIDPLFDAPLPARASAAAHGTEKSAASGCLRPSTTTLSFIIGQSSSIRTG